MADLYHSFHPAVLQALCTVAEAGRAEGKPVSICGELAGDPLAAVLLLAMGYEVLSMNATALPRVKKTLRSITRTDALELLEEVMLLEHSAAVLQRLQRLMTERGLQQFIHAPPV